MFTLDVNIEKYESADRALEYDYFVEGTNLVLPIKISPVFQLL